MLFTASQLRWHGGVVVWSCGGVVAWWCSGVVVWWHGGMVVWRSECRKKEIHTGEHTMIHRETQANIQRRIERYKRADICDRAEKTK